MTRVRHALTLASLLMTTTAWAGALPTQYHVIDLGTAIIRALDDDGNALGQRLGIPLRLRPVEELLEQLPEGISAQGNAILGDLVVGTRGGHATLWRRGQGPLDLGALRADLFSSASALSKRLIVGLCANPDNAQQTAIACTWTLTRGTPSAAQPLPGLGGAFSAANAVNRAGRICGQAVDGSGKTHAVCWQDGQVQDLTPTSAGESRATDVTRHGLVIGTAVLAGLHPNQSHAFAWTPQEGLVDLGVLPGGVDSELLDVTDQRRPLAVGQGCTDTPGGLECTALRVTLDASGHGTLEDLQGLLDTPVRLREAVAVNKLGWIAAIGRDGHGYLLLPVGGDSEEEEDD